MGADRGRCPLFVMNLHLKNDHFLIQLNYYMTFQGGLQARLPAGTQITSSSDLRIEHGNHAPSQRRRPVLNSSARRALTEKTQKAFVRPQKSLSFHVPDLRTGAQSYGMERATGTFAGLSSSRACEY